MRQSGAGAGLPRSRRSRDLEVQARAGLLHCPLGRGGTAVAHRCVGGPVVVRGQVGEVICDELRRAVRRMRSACGAAARRIDQALRVFGNGRREFP